ncbi:MAG TPA: serine hydrolase domain-containing protein [Gemmatimonadaceae bacterium]
MYPGDWRFAQGLERDLQDSIIGEFAPWSALSKAPGAAIAIVRKNRIVWEWAFGLADVENEIPMTTATVLPVASVSKRFTAAAIRARLAARSFTLTTSVGSVMPWLQPRVGAATVEQLLNHTAGVPSPRTGTCAFWPAWNRHCSRPVRGTSTATADTCCWLSFY